MSDSLLGQKRILVKRNEGYQETEGKLDKQAQGAGMVLGPGSQQ